MFRRPLYKHSADSLEIQFRFQPVSARHTDDYPCPMPFSFTFKENELRDYYQGWELAEYREEPGNMHAADEAGNPIRLKFVTMLARKP